MKRLFSHSKKNQEDWEDYDESEYDWDSDEGDYSDEESDEGEFLYADEEEIEEDGWFDEENRDADAYYEAEEIEEAAIYEEADLEEPEGYYEAEPEEAEEEEEYYEAEEVEEAEPLEPEGYYEAEPEEAEEEAECYEAEEVEEVEPLEPEGYYEAGFEEAEEEEPEYYEAEAVEEPAGYYEAEEEADGYYGGEADIVQEPADTYSERLHKSAASYKAEPMTAAEIRKKEKQSESKSGEGFFAKLGKFLRNMDTMDRVMVATGIGVLILAIVTAGVFINASITDKQVADFADVGLQLADIEVIGGRGLVAVADAELAKRTAASVVNPEPEVEEPKKDYEESGYERQVSVQPNLTSIQKDLKIKFINKKTDKLVANVPFSVTITDPDGKSHIWSDDDMDGIIYKKDIAPGTYQVAMEKLTDAKYSDYTISTESQSVEVKKDIAYKKVDVANEVKQESEVNAAKEDTKKNDTVVESSLEDTVAWVESKTTSAVYDEVSKSSIPDPMSLALGGGLVRMSETEVPPAAEAPGTEAPPAAEAPGTETPPTAEAPGTEPSVPEEPVPPEPTPLAGISLSVDQAALTGTVGTAFAAKATAAGYTEGNAIVYSVSSSDPAVATATVDGSGSLSIQGVAVGTAVLTVTANYENGEAATAGTATISVTIQDRPALTLDKTAMTIFTQTPTDINASVANTLSQEAVAAGSSDPAVATVSVNGRVVTVTGVAEGSAVITVSFGQNTEAVSATCTVTVKRHPKEDTATLLKDGSGRQVYVLENGTYREATRADYYTADKFFVQGDAKYTGWQTIDGRVYYFDANGEKVKGEQVIQGAKYNFASDGSLVTGNGVLGIDVSKWNGKIDWNAVKNSGVSYVIIRCGYRGSAEGKLIIDPRFETNIKGASAAGLKVGVYFFSQAVDEIEAVEEASMVLDQIKNYNISYPVFLDVEASGGRGDKIDKATRTAVCKAFCQTIQSANYTAGIYSNKTWLEGRIDAGSLNAYKIWLAQYAAAPSYKGKYDLWQYRSNGSVGGISGNVDMNISYLGY